jgi:hypothetical protein
MIEEIGTILLDNLRIALIFTTTKVVPHQIVGSEIVHALGTQQVDVHLNKQN